MEDFGEVDETSRRTAGPAAALLLAMRAKRPAACHTKEDNVHRELRPNAIAAGILKPSSPIALRPEGGTIRKAIEGAILWQARPPSESRSTRRSKGRR